MQGSRAPSFIAGNELIGCMCPRRCLGAGYGPNRSMIFGSLRSMALQKSRKVRSMALQKSEESLNRETYQHSQTAELCGSNFESKVLEPPSQKPCGLNEMLEPNFLISEATKKRRITLYIVWLYRTRGGVRVERSEPRAATGDAGDRSSRR